MLSAHVSVARAVSPLAQPARTVCRLAQTVGGFPQGQMHMVVADGEMVARARIASTAAVDRLGLGIVSVVVLGLMCAPLGAIGRSACGRFRPCVGSRSVLGDAGLHIQLKRWITTFVAGEEALTIPWRSSNSAPDVIAKSGAPQRPLPGLKNSLRSPLVCLKLTRISTIFLVCRPRLGEVHTIGGVIDPGRLQGQLCIGSSEFQTKITPGDTTDRVALGWIGRTIEIERTIRPAHIHAVIVKIAVLWIGRFAHLPGHRPNGMIAPCRDKPFNHHGYLNSKAVRLFITVVHKLDPMDGMVSAREHDRFDVAWHIGFTQRRITSLGIV